MLAERLIGRPGDSYNFFNDMYIVRENLLHWRHPFAFSDVLRYPVGFWFGGGGFDGALSALVGGVLGFVFQPVLTYNLTILFLALANVSVSAFYFHKMSRASMPSAPDEDHALRACCAGLLFGLSPYVYARFSGHLNLAFIGGFAAFAWAAYVAFVRHGKPVNGHALLRACAAAILLLAMGSVQYLAIAALFAAPLVFCVRPRHVRQCWHSLVTDRKQWSATTLQCCLLAAVFLFIFHGYVIAILTHQLQTVRSGGNNPNVWDFFVPNPYFGSVWSALRLSGSAIGRSVFLGSATIVALGWFLFSSRVRASVQFRVALYLCYVCLLLGGSLRTPFIDMFVRTGSHGRYVIGILLIAACVVAASKIFSARVTRVIVVLAILDRLLLAIPMTAPVPVAVLASARTLPGAGALSLPNGSFEADLIPTFSGKKLVGGIFKYNADIAATRTFQHTLPLSLFSCSVQKRDQADYAKAVRKMLDSDIRTVFVQASACVQVRNTVHAMQEWNMLRNVSGDSQWIVYQLSLPQE